MHVAGHLHLAYFGIRIRICHLWPLHAEIKRTARRHHLATGGLRSTEFTRQVQIVQVDEKQRQKGPVLWNQPTKTRNPVTSPFVYSLAYVATAINLAQAGSSKVGACSFDLLLCLFGEVACLELMGTRTWPFWLNW